jgi:hypothetical protein
MSRQAGKARTSRCRDPAGATGPGADHGLQAPRRLSFEIAVKVAPRAGLRDMAIPSIRKYLWIRVGSTGSGY